MLSTKSQDAMEDFVAYLCRTRHRGGPKNKFSNYEKRIDF